MSSVRTEPIGAGDRAGSPARTAARAAVLAFFVDAFDIYLPVLVLAPAMAYFRPAHLGAGTTALLASLVFPATLVTRPLGAAIFGNLADTVGRKPATLTAVPASASSRCSSPSFPVPRRSGCGRSLP